MTRHDGPTAPPASRTSRSIALCGRSGSGKTTAAEYLTQAYGFAHYRSGELCRRVCSDLFDDDSKAMLNAVTAAMRSIRPDVWISAALRDMRDDVVVFDSMRFEGDYERMRGAGFALWRVEAPLDRRVARLRARGQEFDPSADDKARPEVELDGHEFDYVIDNDTQSMDGLRRAIDAGVAAMARRVPTSAVEEAR